MDDFIHLKQVQKTVQKTVQERAQGSRSIIAKLQSTIVQSTAQPGNETAQAWKEVQTMISNSLIPELNHCLETLEICSTNPALETQLRSLNPEVTRLIKLLQINWQFLQAARQPDRLQQRQQQMTQHLQQLDQLLEAIVHHLRVCQE